MSQNIFDELEKQLKNPNLTREQKVRLIEDAGNKYRNSIDDDLKKYIRNQRIGAGLQIGSVIIPGNAVGGTISGKIIPKVVQKTLGRQFTTDVAASAIGGAIDGAVYGYGRNMMENKNPLKTIVEDSAFGFGAGAAVGGTVGNLVSKIRSANTKGIKQMSKHWGIPWRKASGNPEIAIKTLMENQRGFVPNVFNKPGIGNFDIPWGNEKYGLKHAIERRSGQKNLDIDEFVNTIPQSIREGIVTQGNRLHPDTKHINSLKHDLAIIPNFNHGEVNRNWLVTAIPQSKKARKLLSDGSPSQNISSENGTHSISELLAKDNINDYLLKNNPAKWLNDKISTTGVAIKNLETQSNTATEEYSPLFKTGIEYNNTEAKEKIFTPEEIGKMSQQEFNTHEHAIRNQLQRGLINPQDKDFSGFKNPLSGNNKIYTKEDIDNMSNEEFSNSEQEINAQWGTIGIPSNNELQHNSGAVYVEGYTRADGTKVKGYYRSR